ncbi:MAG: hypothetical protein ACWGOV_12380 [Acidiferrobacterales bacterium]
MLEEFVDEERQLTIHIFTGEVLGKDVIEAVKALYASGPTLNHLWDLTDADMSAVKSEDLQEIALIAKQSSTSGRNGRTAIVSNSDLGYGLSRMYGSFAEMSGHSTVVRSFRTRKEAEEWIAEQ